MIENNKRVVIFRRPCDRRAYYTGRGRQKTRPDPEISVAGSFLEQVGKDPGRLRIALCKNKLGEGDFSAEVTQAVEEIGGVLTDLVHHVEHAEPSYDRAAAGRAVWNIIAVNTVLAIKMRAEELGRKVTDQDIEPTTRSLMRETESQACITV